MDKPDAFVEWAFSPEAKKLIYEIRDQANKPPPPREREWSDDHPIYVTLILMVSMVAFYQFLMWRTRCRLRKRAELRKNAEIEVVFVPTYEI